jgi:hypothetical protein
LSQIDWTVPPYELETQPMGSSEKEVISPYFRCEMASCQKKSTVKMSSQYHERIFEVCENHAKNLFFEFRSAISDLGPV